MVKYLPYLKLNVNVNETAYGFKDINGLDTLFNGFQARDKVLCKSDVLLNMSDLFEQSTLTKYRAIIYSIVTGITRDAATLSKLLTALYTDDSKFKEYLEAIYYLEDGTESFGKRIIDSLVQRINAVKSLWTSHFKKCGCKVFLFANCCIYYAVDDRNFNLPLPDGCVCEVLTHAKNWKGTFNK